MNLPWEPAIYEHKAALIGLSPAEVSRSADLLARSLEAEHRAYAADFMTVGIDVYNIEAESVGALVAEIDAVSCPEIRTPPFSLERFERLDPPDTRRTGRYSMLIEAARIARRRIDGEVKLRIAASGPASIASKLIGIEPLVIGLASEDDAIGPVLESAQSLCRNWLSRIREEGFDAIVFDSTAAPPVMSPAMYRTHVLPLHAELMDLLEALGQRDRPLIIGGNTTEIVADMCEAGATTVICDFPAGAEEFSRAVGDSQCTVRRNLDPSLFSSESSLEPQVETFASDIRRFERPIAGTGILAYNADPDRFQRFRARTMEVLN